jgi:hypothetical protein
MRVRISAVTPASEAPSPLSRSAAALLPYRRRYSTAVQPDSESGGSTESTLVLVRA